MSKKLEWREHSLYIDDVFVGWAHQSNDYFRTYDASQYPTEAEARAALERVFADTPAAPTERRDRIVVTEISGVRRLIKDSYFDSAIVGGETIYLSMMGVMNGFSRDNFIEGDFDRLVAWVMGE